MATSPHLDFFYCQEDNFELEDDNSPPSPKNPDAYHHLFLAAEASKDNWSNVLSSLNAKASAVLSYDNAENYLQSARTPAVEWVLRSVAVHNFSSLTALLAVNYLDHCFLGCGLRVESDRPWMGQLAAVACLSLAAKVEETRVPLLIDLQQALGAMEAKEFVFESKTIQRMELLVLSSLGWRMNPVTPLSFVDHIVLRLCSNDFDGCGGGAVVSVDCVGDLVRSCEKTLVSAVADPRWVRYSASVWAAAALHYALSSISLEADEVQQTIALLNVPKEKVLECHQVMLECMTTFHANNSRKRKRSLSSPYDFNCSSPPSPSGVIGSCFSRESSLNSYDSGTM